MNNIIRGAIVAVPIKKEASREVRTVELQAISRHPEYYILHWHCTWVRYSQTQTNFLVGESLCCSSTCFSVCRKLIPDKSPPPLVITNVRWEFVREAKFLFCSSQLTVHKRWMVTQLRAHFLSRMTCRKTDEKQALAAPTTLVVEQCGWSGDGVIPDVHLSTFALTVIRTGEL